jgi:glutathione S-transferase
VAANLYWFPISHPSQAARLMLERKQIDYRPVNLMPGLHPMLVRVFGFQGTTVPALRLDGRRVQGSLAISRVLDEIEPESPLFPPDGGRRRAVEEAEIWGERVLQPIPRRIFRWWLSSNREARVLMAREVMRMPAPRLMAATNGPIVRALARKSRAYTDRVRADVSGLAAKLDHVDTLIADGVIGEDEPNAADYQIGTSVRALMVFDDLRPLVETRPAGKLALTVLPEFGAPMPRFLPRDWL